MGQEDGVLQKAAEHPGGPPQVLQGLKEGDHVKGQGPAGAVEPHLPGEEEDGEEVLRVMGHGDHVGPLVPPGLQGPQGHP